MKHLHIFSILLLTSTAATSQTIVSGKISNPKDKIVKLSYWNGDNQVIESPLQKDGSFRITSTLAVPQQYNLETSGEYTSLFLFPGDSVFVTINTKEFDESVTYSGKGADVNNFLAKKVLHFENTIGSPDFMQEYYTKLAFSEPEVFCVYADSIAQIKLDYLSKYKDVLPAVFYDFEYADIVYETANNKADYPFMHFYLRGIKDSVVKVNDDYYKFYQTLSVSNENYLLSDFFESYLSNYIYYRAKKELKRDSVSFEDKVELAKVLLNGNIKQRAIANEVIKTISYDKSEKAKRAFDLSKNEITDEVLLASIESLYRKKEKLFSGNLAPAISLKNKDGKLVNLSDYRGKVVYLDFWASWCGPCMMEMPSAKKLQDSFATKEVIFLYVSIDESEKAWKDAIQKHKLGGVHVRAEGFDANVAKDYNINGVPTYFLIGRDGKIIDNNPSRPSGANVIAEIEEALKL